MEGNMNIPLIVEMFTAYQAVFIVSLIADRVPGLTNF